MAKPFTPVDSRKYDAVSHDIRHRMRATDRSGRVTVEAVSNALRAAGYSRSPRYVRAVLSGEKTSRPALREISAAVRAIRDHAESDLPDWL